VDDAEDADVVLHEFGHAIHYWITGLKSSSSQGLGEGSGDYWPCLIAEALTNGLRMNLSTTGCSVGTDTTSVGMAG
jgi:hypothetical protein